MTIAYIVELASEQLLSMVAGVEAIPDGKAREPGSDGSRSLAHRMAENVAEYLYSVLQSTTKTNRVRYTAEDSSGDFALTGYTYTWPDDSQTLTGPAGARTLEYFAESC